MGHVALMPVLLRWSGPSFAEECRHSPSDAREAAAHCPLLTLSAKRQRRRRSHFCGIPSSALPEMPGALPRRRFHASHTLRAKRYWDVQAQEPVPNRSQAWPAVALYGENTDKPENHSFLLGQSGTHMPSVKNRLKCPRCTTEGAPEPEAKLMPVSGMGTQT